MEFRTKLVVHNRSKRAIIAYIGLAIAASSMLLVFFRSLEDFLPWVFGAGVLIILLGALLAKGRIATSVLSEEDLVLGLAGIAIGSRFYAMEEVEQLDVDVQVYAGMLTEAWGMPKDAFSDGMGNYLSFTCKGQKINCRFYLNSQAHTMQLGLLFKTFYERHIPFVERRGSARTYLLRELSPGELEAFKKEYRYK